MNPSVEAMYDHAVMRLFTCDHGPHYIIPALNAGDIVGWIVQRLELEPDTTISVSLHARTPAEEVIDVFRQRLGMHSAVRFFAIDDPDQKLDNSTIILYQIRTPDPCVIPRENKSGEWPVLRFAAYRNAQRLTLYAGNYAVMYSCPPLYPPLVYIPPKSLSA